MDDVIATEGFCLLRLLEKEQQNFETWEPRWVSMRVSIAVVIAFSYDDPRLIRVGLLCGFWTKVILPCWVWEK